MTGVVVLAPRPGPCLPPVTGTARPWTLFATAGHPLTAPLSAMARTATDGAPATAVLLGADFAAPDNDLLLDGVRTAVRRGGRLVLVHLGAGGASLIRAALAENRALRGVSVELPPAPSAAAIDAAVAVAGSELSRTDELRVDAAGRIGATDWRRVALPAAPAAGQLGGAAVVTGGLGGLGIRAAAVLGHRYGLHPVLIDSRTPDQIGPRARRWLRCLAGAPPGLTVRTADVTRPAQATAALTGLPAPVAVVLHCAGVLPLGSLAGCRADDLAAAQAVKVDGLRHVVAAVDHRALRHLVVFGSALAESPPHGLGGYALANELLRRAALRVGASLPRAATVVAQFSIWAGAGMAYELGVVPQARRLGWSPIPLWPGLAALPRLLAVRPGPARLQLLGPQPGWSP